MAGSDWISAREALRRATDAGVTAGDLMEWARQGLLPARTKRYSDSDDDPLFERTSPPEPPSGEEERATLGSWPDIPTDFWEGSISKALWAAGVFSAMVNYFDGHRQCDDRRLITLFDVTFHAGELERRLTGQTFSDLKPQQVEKRWRAQHATNQQKFAMDFMSMARKFPGKDPLRPVVLYEKYLDWAKQKKSKPLVRSAFTKWAKRHDEGWRLQGGQWVFNP